MLALGHRDSGQTDGWPLPHTRIVKVFLPLFDVELNTGPSAVVPLTHRLEEAPQQVATFGSAGGLQADRPGMEQAAMPNYIPFAVSCTTSLTSGLQSSQGDSDIVADTGQGGDGVHDGPVRNFVSFVGESLHI